MTRLERFFLRKPSRANILRRALQWPLVWRLVVSFTKGLPHVEGNNATCLVCLAKARVRRDVHVMALSHQRIAHCKKCGLPNSVWRRSPKCRGFRLGVIEQAAQPAYRIMPLNWE